MNCRLFFHTLFFITIFGSCNSNDREYAKLLDKELADSKSFLEAEIVMQESFIKSKVNDYPYLETSFDSLNKIKMQLNNFDSQIINLKDSILISQFKNRIEKHNIRHFEFNSLNIKSGFLTDSLFRKILKLDLMKIKYQLNQKYISGHCNVIA